ncbi:MAG: HNH endonuclease [Defluviitaleaceae bacterium]|nr:HNH endonuclease [Defluviitaleaceae bacterium]MCL2263968.1 HNH endonuclease [Defluviitaleaceae bacterium]
MPDKAYKTCTYPGCSALTKSRRCEKHSTKNPNKESQYEYDRFRRDKSSKSFYNSPEWIKLRKAVLVRDNHLCQHCLQAGRLTPATTVHHKQHLRHRRDLALNADNLVSLCARCHNQEH